MAKYYPPVVHYDEERNEFRLILPPELYYRARHIPGMIERKKQGVWASTATAGVAARIVEEFGRNLKGNLAFKAYLTDRYAGHIAAQQILSADPEELNPIPITDIQPKGVWLHQRKAFWFAYQLEAAMLDITMGGGKTKIATDLMQNWGSDPVLIISPLAPIEDAWIPHLEEHLINLPSMFLSRTQFKKLAEFTSACDAMLKLEPHKYDDPAGYKHRIILINHEAFWREPFRAWAKSVRWGLVIADEIHREKSAGSLQSRFLQQLGRRANRRLGLTGTLMPHSPLDVYGQYHFLDHGILGTSVDKFRSEHAVMGGFENREVVAFKKLPELMRKIDTITIHVDDSNQGLPEVAPDILHKFNLEPRTRRVYDEMDEEFITKWKRGEVTAANAGVKLLRLHQIASGVEKPDGKHAVLVDDTKIRALKEILRDFNKDEPIVIFTRFTVDMWAIHNALEKLGDVAVVGDGHNELSAWKRDRKFRFLVAQIQAIKEGVDLTRSAVGIFYSTGISLGDYLQCRKRLHRPPQKKYVRFIHILARGTRDVSTYRALRDRHDVIKDLRRKHG